MAGGQSQSFGLFIPNKRHLVRGKGGVAGEVDDLRNDLDTAFAQLEQEFQLGIKNNFSATSNPTTADDSTAGYSVGSTWVNTSSSQVFAATDVTPGSAIWIELTVTVGGLPSGPASGQLGGTYPSPDVRGMRETGGPTLLTYGAVADGEFLRRVGATVVGVAAPPPAVHDLGGPEHAADTLANLNSKITDATLDDVSGTRDPNVHALAGAAHSSSTLAQLNALVSDATLDDSGDTRPPIVHGLGSAFHSSTTLAALNALISDATLDDQSATRTPTVHSLGGAEHSSTNLAGLNALISDATLDDVSAPRTPSGAASGQLGGTYPGPDVRGLRETTGPTLLTYGSIADGEALRRSGTTVIGGVYDGILVFGNDSVGFTTTTRYLDPWYEDRLATTAPQEWELTRGGTLRKLRIRQNAPAGNGNAIAYTVYKNGVSTSLSAVIASTGTSATDLVNTVSVAAGDRLSVVVTKGASVDSSVGGVFASMELAP